MVFGVKLLQRKNKTLQGAQGCNKTRKWNAIYSNEQQIRDFNGTSQGRQWDDDGVNETITQSIQVPLSHLLTIRTTLRAVLSPTLAHQARRVARTIMTRDKFKMQLQTPYGHKRHMDTTRMTLSSIGALVAHVTNLT